MAILRCKINGMSKPEEITIGYVKDVIGPRCQEVFEGFCLLGVVRRADGTLERTVFWDSTSSKNQEVTKALDPAVRVARSWGREQI